MRIIITLPMLSTSQQATGTAGMARSRQQYHSVDDGAVDVAILDRASIRKCRHVKMDGDRVRETEIVVVGNKKVINSCDCKKFKLKVAPTA